MNNVIPWVEKYRPQNMDSIILTPNNRTILKNIIEQNHFPNLLFYGPPGTGKTTTIVNLIKQYQAKYDQDHSELITHLNASDERGIDVIRNQIHIFVNNECMFRKGIKFIILDEVDAMTDNAQHALHFLLQNTSDKNVKFCLICNYITKVYSSLQGEFLQLKFNKLPRKKIKEFLTNIAKKENIKLSDHILQHIIYQYDSDIRSMINFMQCNHAHLDNNILDANIKDSFIDFIKKNRDNKHIEKWINTEIVLKRIDVVKFIKLFLLYLVMEKKNYDEKLLGLVNNVFHTKNSENHIFVKYICSELMGVSFESSLDISSK